MARRATRPDPISPPNGASDSRRRRSARNNRPPKAGSTATDDLTGSLQSSRAGHEVGDFPPEIEVIPESQNVQEPLDRPAERGEPRQDPAPDPGGDNLQQKQCEARVVGKTFSGWHELNSTTSARCRETSQHHSSISRAETDVSIAGDVLSTQIVAEGPRDDVRSISSEGNGGTARGGEDRTEQTFRGESTTTKVCRSSSNNNSSVGNGVDVLNHQTELSDNSDEAKTPRQSHQVEGGVINHILTGGGQQTTAAMITTPKDWERKVVLDATDSIATPPAAAPAGARPSGEISMCQAMSPRLSPGEFHGVACESDRFTGGGGGESRCFRKSGEKQLLFMIIANPELCPNKESSNNLRERDWGLVRELVTRPTPVEVTLKDGNAQTVTVALDSEQLTDNALKKRWQTYRTKYERRAKEHSKSHAVGKGVEERLADHLYVDDGSSESLWLAKAVRAWDAAKLEKRRKSALDEAAAEAAKITEACSLWEAREIENASGGPTIGRASLASPDLNEGGTKRAASVAAAMSPRSTPNKRPRTEEVGGHDSAKDTCIQEDSGVNNNRSGEDNGDRDVGKELVKVVEDAAGAGEPSGVDDLSASAGGTAAATAAATAVSGGDGGGVLHAAASKACRDDTARYPPSSLSRPWSTPSDTPRGGDASAASLPSSGRRRAGDSGATTPVAEQLISLLAQKTAAELEAKRVETDLKRAQAEALRRGGGRAPAEAVVATGRIAPVPLVGDAFAGLPDAASMADAPAVSVRDALSSLARQVQGLRADVWSIRDESRRLREELRETNSGVRLLLERFAFSSSSYPSAGGAPSFGGGSRVAGASSPRTNDGVGAEDRHPRPPEMGHFGPVAQGVGPVRW